MGDAEDGPPTFQKSGVSKQLEEKQERFIVDTMKLTDPQRVAKRARQIAASYPQTARFLMERAKMLQQAQKAAKAPEAVYRAAKSKDPLPIFNLKWTKFLYSLVRDISDVTHGHVGYFFFAWPRLVALKLATNLRKEEKDGRRTWTAEMVEPPTLEEFLKSSKLQYDAFVKSVIDYLPTLTAPRFEAFIGKEIEGKRVSLSGLLAIAHVAGIEGLKSWLANAGDREKYPNTTGAYLKSTEIF